MGMTNKCPHNPLDTDGLPVIGDPCWVEAAGRNLPITAVMAVMAAEIKLACNRRYTAPQRAALLAADLQRGIIPNRRADGKAITGNIIYSLSQMRLCGNRQWAMQDVWLTDIGKAVVEKLRSE